MRSIRAQLITRLVPTWFTLLAIGAITLDLALERSLGRQLDLTLEAKANALASLLFDQGDHVEFEFADEAMPEFSPGREAEFFEIRRADGSLLERSLSLQGRALSERRLGDQSLAHWDVTLPDGRAGRLVAMRARSHYEPPDGADSERPPRESPAVELHVARSRADLDRFAIVSRWSIGIGALLLGLAVTATALRAVRIALRPLERLGAAVASSGPDSRELPLAQGTLPSELAPIRQRLDELLARSRAAIERERRFTSAAAHELRTPIAELLTENEVALKWPRDAAATRETLETNRAIALQMQSLVASLLALARDPDGHIPIQRSEVDVHALIERELVSLRREAEGRRFKLGVRVEPGLRVGTDAVLLTGILRNLFENAAHYTPDGGQVEIDAGASGDGVWIAVVNTNAMLVADDLQRLTEPFWRKDGARDDRRHSGLGLSLAADLARALGATLVFDLPDGKLRARISLPTRT